MKATYFSILLIIVCTINFQDIVAQASTPFTITGNVYSAKDSLPLKGIKIMRQETDSTGFFKIEGFIEEYEMQFYDENGSLGKVQLSFIDNDDTRTNKYLKKNTIVDLYDRHINIYLEEEK